MKKLFIIIVLIIYACGSKAQDTINKWNYSIGLTFTAVPVVQISGSDTTFQNSLSVAPAFSIRNHSGIGISYSPAFVTGGPNSGIYMHKITAGFTQYDKKKFDIVAEYSHFFFTNNTAIPFTPISNEVELGATYKKSVIRPKLYTDIGFGTDKSISSSTTAYDIAITAGLSHSFDWESGSVNLNATPSLMLNAGTNSYFSFLGISKYISHSKKFNTVIKNSHAKNNGGSGNNQTTSTGTKSQLSINYLEFNLESSLETGSFSLRPAGSLFFPTSSGMPIDGYWELTLSYEF